MSGCLIINQRALCPKSKGENMIETCPICKSYLNSKSAMANADQYVLDCPRCGRFNITGTLQAMLMSRIDEDNDDWRWILSHWIRKRQGESQPVVLGVNDFKIIPQEMALPSLGEQADNLIYYLGKTLKAHSSILRPNTHMLPSLLGAKESSDVDYIASYLQDEGYLYFKKLSVSDVWEKDVTITNDTDKEFGLTVKGWFKFEEMKKSSSNSKFAFMAMEYNDELVETARSVFRPAVLQTGFDLRILRDYLKPGLIDNQMIVEIKKSRFLLVELTHRNNGAYWEAGYAEGLGKPVIYLCEKSEFEKNRTHFDTNHHTTIVWDKQNFEQSMRDLKAVIRITFPTEAKMSDD